MRWLVCTVTALCLLAAPAVRPDDGRAHAAQLKQAPATSHAPVQAPVIALASAPVVPAPPAATIARVELPTIRRGDAPTVQVAARGPPQR